MRSSVYHRPLALLACIVQLVLGGGAGFADAWLEGASLGPAAAHVEESGQKCPPVHPEDCVVCRQLTVLYGPPRGADGGASIAARSSQIDPGETEPTLPRLSRTALPRAPPLP